MRSFSRGFPFHLPLPSFSPFPVRKRLEIASSLKYHWGSVFSSDPLLSQPRYFSLPCDFAAAHHPPPRQPTLARLSTTSISIFLTLIPLSYRHSRPHLLPCGSSYPIFSLPPPTHFLSFRLFSSFFAVLDRRFPSTNIFSFLSWAERLQAHQRYNRFLFPVKHCPSHYLLAHSSLFFGFSHFLDQFVATHLSTTLFSASLLMVFIFADLILSPPLYFCPRSPMPSPSPLFTRLWLSIRSSLLFPLTRSLCSVLTSTFFLFLHSAAHPTLPSFSTYFSCFHFISVQFHTDHVYILCVLLESTGRLVSSRSFAFPLTHKHPNVICISSYQL